VYIVFNINIFDLLILLCWDSWYIYIFFPGLVGFVFSQQQHLKKPVARRLWCKAKQAITYFFVADGYWFQQRVTVAQRSAVSQREKTQQHNSNTIHHLDGRFILLLKIFLLRLPVGYPLSVHFTLCWSAFPLDAYIHESVLMLAIISKPPMWWHYWRHTSFLTTASAVS